MDTKVSLRLSVVVSWLALGCGGSGGGEGSDRGSDDGGDESDGGQCPLVDDIECDIDRISAAHYAPQIPGCFGADVDPPPDPNPGENLGSGDGFVVPGLVDSEATPAQVGVWTEIVDNEGHLPVHSIHRPTGKFLHFGYDSNAGPLGIVEDKSVWFPPEPCENPSVETCDVSFDIDPLASGSQNHVEVFNADPDMAEVSLFCAGHVNLPPAVQAETLYPRTLTVGGSRVENINQSIPGAYVFWEADPNVSSTDYDWTEVDDLSSYRWYPTATVLADGRIAVPGGTFSNVGSLRCKTTQNGVELQNEECACEAQEGDFYFDLGICVNGYCLAKARDTEEDTGEDIEAGIVEQLGFDPCWTVNETSPGIEVGERTLPATNPPEFEEDDDELSWSVFGADHLGVYPQMFVLPDLPHFSENHLGGTYVKVGSEANWAIGSGAQMWDPANPTEPLRELGGISCARGSSAVMYAADKILKFGGTGGASTGIASRVSEVLDLSTPCPVWRPAGPTGVPRHFSSGVLLPDGTTLALGGSASTTNLGDDDNVPAYAVFTAELFQPNDDPEAELAGSWCRLADDPGAESDNVVYRGYHSQSFLLPDGRVYHGSGGLSEDPAVDHYDYHIYAPPYLFWGPRPEFSLDPLTIANGIAWMEAGDTDPVILTLPEGFVEITRVTMVKLSSSTHQFDQEQRFVELEILPEDEDFELHAAPPPSTCYATPGYYMLFAISSDGVPSVGKYVAVHGGCAEAAEPAFAPEPLLPAPRAVNDLLASGATGLRASCGGEGSQLTFSDFGQSLLDLCAATGACPSDGTINVEVRFVSTTGSASVGPNDLLSSAVVTIADGEPSFFSDGIEINVAGTEFTSNVHLGPGDHVVEVCGTLSLLSACIEQPLRIDPELAHDGEYRAGSIERRELVIDRHPIRGHTVDLDLGDDDVAEVELPDGFVFPFYGEEVDTLWVGANGAVRIDEGTVPATNTSLPETGKPQIAVYWDDLDPSEAGRVRTHYDGDRFIVAWEGVAVAAGGQVSAQLHLHRSGRIEMHYPHASSGPSAHGVSATIGIQHDIEALALSVNDDELLAANDAIAIDVTSCIASRLRLPDTTPCTDRLATSPKDIGICSGAVDVLLTAPRVSTMCEPHKEANVSGSVWLGPDRQAVAQDGSVQLYVGDYQARWTMQEPVYGPSGVGYHDVGAPASELLRVRLTDDPEVCCREDQEVHTLTASGDTAAYADNEPVCVVAQGGSDVVDGDVYDDTLLGQGGDDELDGGNGNDIVFGGVGDDTLAGGAGEDVLLGGEDDDTLAGNAGDDELWGGNGDDVLAGGADSDILVPGAGQDAVDGGPGDDHVVILHRCELVSGETLDGGPDWDTLWLPSGLLLTDLPFFGVTVSNFEAVETLEGGAWGTAECLL